MADKTTSDTPNTGLTPELTTAIEQMIASALIARIGDLPEGKTVILVIDDKISASIGGPLPEGKTIVMAIADEVKTLLSDKDLVDASPLGELIDDKINTSFKSDLFRQHLDDSLKDFKPTIAPEDIAEQLQGMDWHAIAAEAQAKAADTRRASDAAAEAERQKSQEKADRAASKRAEQAAADRSAKQVAATKQFQQLFGDGSTPATADLSLLPNTSIVLLVDNGEAFCVDVAIDPLDRATLRQIDDRSIQLDRKIDLGKGIGEAFTVRGVDLIFGASDALRCELATPLTIGGGREAHLPEGSLVFRAQPPVSAEA